MKRRGRSSTKSEPAKKRLQTEPATKIPEDELTMGIPVKMQSQDRIAAARAMSLPEKSLPTYQKFYAEFTDWCKKEGFYEDRATEDVLLLYFGELSKTNKASTLWTKSSAIKSMMYAELGGKRDFPDSVVSFLKAKSKAYKPKKSLAFTKEQAETYLKLEPVTNENIVLKLSFAIGLLGALRGMENTMLMWENFNIQEEHIICTFTRLKKSKSDEKSSFFITKNQDPQLDIYALFHEYLVRVPENLRTGRLWLQYKANTRLGWTKMVIGRTFFSKLPSVVATALNLPDPELYTGHCLRATSATILADEGVSILTLKRHGDWKSDTIAEGYVRDSSMAKQDVSQMLMGNARNQTSSLSNGVGGFNISNCTIGTIVIKSSK